MAETESQRIDGFEAWLALMPDALDELVSELPPEVSAKLDFSGQSLDVLEAYILGRYDGVATILADPEKLRLDQLARYVGETFRQSLGGNWFISYEDQSNVFYGLPQLTGLLGQRTQICPMSLVSACTDRRTGSYLRKIFENHRARGGAS